MLRNIHMRRDIYPDEGIVSTTERTIPRPEKREMLLKRNAVGAEGMSGRRGIPLVFGALIFLVVLLHIR